MATISLYAGKVNLLPQLLKDVKQSIIDYNQELYALKSKTLTISKSICDLEDITSSIQFSTQMQNQKIDSLNTIDESSQEFILEVVCIDEDVAEIVRQHKEEFYEAYSYLKPECEKNEWEKIKDACRKAGEWCREHWKQFAIGFAFIFVGAILIALTGGAFSIFLAALATGLKAALVSAVISGVMSFGISLVTSVVNGESIGTSLGEAMGAFADGFASGFMLGGVMAGVSMTLSATFKIAAKLGASTGRNGGFGKNGLLKFFSPDRIAGDGNGGGTIIKFGKTLRLDVDTRILQAGRCVNPLKMANFLHLHIPGVTGNIPQLLIVSGHIPIGLYLSSIFGAIWRDEWNHILNGSNDNDEK